MTESFLPRVAERDLAIKQPARRLYDLLIKPTEAQLRGVRRVCIVPDGTLWNVPFQALHQGERGYLLEQYAVVYAPSLSVLREMGRRAHALKTGHHATTVTCGFSVVAAGNGQSGVEWRYGSESSRDSTR